MVLSDMVHGCVCGYVEELCWLDFVPCAYPEGGLAAG
jgi:hypothetical protein